MLQKVKFEKLYLKDQIERIKMFLDNLRPFCFVLFNML